MYGPPSSTGDQQPGVRNVEKGFLFFASALFLFFFAFIAFHNRFSADDYARVFLHNHHSILGTVKSIYNDVNGRWAAMILSGFIFPLLKDPFLLGLFNILTLLLFVCAVYVFAGSLLTNLYASPGDKQTIIPNSTLFLSSFLFTAFYFFLGAGKSEMWFWFSAMPQYIYSIIAFLFGSGLLLKQNKKILHYLLMIIALCYSGGAFEGYAIIFMLIIIITIIYLAKRKKSKQYARIIAVAVISLIAAFSVNLLAPGNIARASWLPDRDLLTGLLMTLKTIYHIVVERGFKIAFATVVFFPFFVLLGNALFRKIANPFPHPGKFFLWLAIIISVLCFLSIFIPAYILSDIPPKRALALAYFFLGAFITLAGIYTGFTYALHLMKMFAAGFILIIVYNAYIQFPQVVAYSKAVDERLALIEMERNTFKGDILELSPLPPSGMIHTAEISEDTASWNNRNLRKGLELNFAVRRKK